VDRAEAAGFGGVKRRLVQAGLAHPAVSDEEQGVARAVKGGFQGRLDPRQHPLAIEQGRATRLPYRCLVGVPPPRHGSNDD
jgi:hypothetical protein